MPTRGRPARARARATVRPYQVLVAVAVLAVFVVGVVIRGPVGATLVGLLALAAAALLVLRWPQLDPRLRIARAVVVVLCVAVTVSVALR